MDEQIVEFLKITNPALSTAVITAYSAVVSAYDEYDNNILLGMLYSSIDDQVEDSTTFERIASIIRADAVHLLAVSGILLSEMCPMPILASTLSVLYSHSTISQIDTQDYAVLFKSDPLLAFATLVADTSTDENPVSVDHALPHILVVSDFFVNIVIGNTTDTFSEGFPPRVQRYVELFSGSIVATLISDRSVFVGGSLDIYKVIFNELFPLPEDEGLVEILGIVVISDTDPPAYLDSIVDQLTLYYPPESVARLTLAASGHIKKLL